MRGKRRPKELNDSEYVMTRKLLECDQCDLVEDQINGEAVFTRFRHSEGYGEPTDMLFKGINETEYKCPNCQNIIKDTEPEEETPITNSEQKVVAEDLYDLGIQELNDNNIGLAISLWEEAYKRLTGIRDFQNEILQKLLIQLGHAHRLKQDYDNAIDCFETCIKIRDKLDIIPKDTCILLEDLAEIYELKDGNNINSRHIREKVFFTIETAKKLEIELDESMT